MILIRLALAVILAGYLLALNLPGTTDITDFWLRWSDLTRAHGLAGGYIVANSDYPPGAFLLLFFISHAAGWMQLGNFILLKVCLAGAALLGAGVFWRWRHNLAATAALLFAVLLNSAAHGYLDAFYLPFFLLSLRLLQQRRLELASLLFCLSISVKWQPLVIAPFWLAHACELRWDNLFQPRQWLGSLRRVALGALPVLVGAGVLFTPTAILHALRQALTYHTALSYQALNLNWVIQFVVYKSGGFANVRFFDPPPPFALSLLARILFYGSYGFTLIAFLRGRKGFADFLWYAGAGFLAYFTLNIGVHENHLFVAMLLAFASLCAPLPGAPARALFVGVMANLNLLLFYGLDGRTPISADSLIDVTLVLGLLNTAYLAVLLWQVAQRSAAGPLGRTGIDDPNRTEPTAS